LTPTGYLFVTSNDGFLSVINDSTFHKFESLTDEYIYDEERSVTFLEMDLHLQNSYDANGKLITQSNSYNSKCIREI